MRHARALGTFFAGSKHDATISESTFEPMLNRPDPRRTPLVNRVIHDPVQLARDLFHDVLFGLWRLRKAGAVHKKRRIEIVSEALQQPVNILPDGAQSGQHQAWEEPLDQVGEIGD